MDKYDSKVHESNMQATDARIKRIESNFDKLSVDLEENTVHTVKATNELKNIKSWSKKHSDDLESIASKVIEIEKAMSKNDGSSEVINKVVLMFIVPVTITMSGVLVTGLINYLIGK